jgi:RNA polymerase sigma factor (sigma-70 family)
MPPIGTASHPAGANNPVLELVVPGVASLLHQYFRRRVPAAEAEDLVQVVLLDAVRAVANGRGPTTAAQCDWRRYLLACARRRCVDWLRSRGRRSLVLVEAELQARARGERARNDSMSALAGLPSALERALAQLSPTERTVARLHVQEGMSKRVIGRLTRRPESSVRRILDRALGSLQRELRNCGFAS